MKVNSDNILKLSAFVLIIGVVLVVAAPFIFTRQGFISFQETGQIGDTIGGVTAPIINMIGAILVFFALQAQVEANRIIQKQIDEQKTDEVQRKTSSNLFEIYKLIKEDFDNFTYTRDETQGSFEDMITGKIQRNYVTYTGREAFEYFIRDISTNKCRKGDDASFFKEPKYISFVDSIKVLETLAKKSNSDDLAQLDKETLNALLKYLFDSRLAPSLNEKDSCSRCNKSHEKIPADLKQLLGNVKKNLNSNS